MYKKIITLFVFILGIPAIIFGCSKLIISKQYYVASALIIALALAALFLSLEKKKMQTRELVAIACVVALAVVGRAARFRCSFQTYFSVRARTRLFRCSAWGL